MEGEKEEIAMKEQILTVLEALKQASQELQSNPTESPAIKALLQLSETEFDSFLASDPKLSTLSHLLSDLKSLVSSRDSASQGRFTSFLTRRVTAHEISRVASSIEAEIQAWIDRVAILGLTAQLRRLRSLAPPLAAEDTAAVKDKLTRFHEKLATGFDLNLQDLLLKSRIFSEIEFVVCSENYPQGVRENAAYALKELVLFNKDVFVGQVLTGQSIKSLVSMGTNWSLEVLSALIRAIRSPLVDFIQSIGGISTIISYLNSNDSITKTAAMDCVIEMGYFGRKEAIEAMLNNGLIKRLMELQRSEMAAEEHHPFASCVARFAVQLEVGEGLRQRERRALKQEILKRVSEAAVSDAESATVTAEVLWGSSP